MGFLRLVGRTESSHARFPLGEHDHDSAFEVCYLKRGSQTFAVGGKKYVIRGGEFFMTYPRERHSSGGEPLEKSALYWVIIDPKATDGLASAGHGALDLITPLLESMRNGQVRTAVSIAHPEVDFNAIFASWDDPPQMRTPRVVRSLLAILLAFIDSSQKEGPNRVSDEVRAVVDAVESSPGERWAMFELAEIAGLSVSHLRHRFEIEMGMPPTEFANRARIDEAKPMLASGQSITDIAHDLGFPSSQYFATVFKKFTGQTPSEYTSDHLKTGQ